MGGGQDKPAWTACPPGVKITRVGGKITRDSLPPGGQAVQGGKINCYTGLEKNGNFWSNLAIFLKKFLNCCGIGVWCCYCPNLIRRMHLMVCVLGHEVLRKCSNFFQEDFELGLDPKIELEEGSIPRYHQTVSWGACGIRTAA